MYHDDAPLTPEDVENGSYFRKARQWYSDMYHYPIAERSFFILIILFAIVNGVFGVQSFLGIFPLSVKVPFLVYSDDEWTDLPLAVKIASTPVEDKNKAVMRYMLQNYVFNREAYDLEHYELHYRNVASQSTSGVFERFKDYTDATNPYSPYRIYTNRFKRLITMNSYEVQEGGKESNARITFYATVVGVFDGREVKHSKFQVDLTYQYVNFEVDQSLDSYVWVARLLGLTGESIKASGEKRKIVPMKFVVSSYNVKELLE